MASVFRTTSVGDYICSSWTFPKGKGFPHCTWSTLIYYLCSAQIRYFTPTKKKTKPELPYACIIYYTYIILQLELINSCEIPFTSINSHL